MLVVQRQTIPVHPHIALLVLATSLVNTVFIFLVVGVGFKFEKEGRLIFISEAFEAYCGWSGVVLGTTGAAEAFVQFLAALHMDCTTALVATGVQLVTWNVIIGVSDTGWPMHYVALVIFFFATCVFHWLASISQQYSSQLYRQFNLLNAVMVLMFGALFLANGVGRFTETQKKSLISAEVTIEFGLLLLIMAQQACLAYGIGKCTRLWVVFEDVVGHESDRWVPERR